jgi:hypothetical protein
MKVFAAAKVSASVSHSLRPAINDSNKMFILFCVSWKPKRISFLSDISVYLERNVVTLLTVTGISNERS